MNNYLRADRYKETQFKDEKSQLYLGKNEEYTLDPNFGTPMVDQRCTQNRIDKNSIDKNININNKGEEVFEYDWLHDKDE